MMPPEFLCHLPFLRMEADSAQPLEPIGRLEPLPYEDWLLLEDPAMAEQERRYRNVAPIFVRVELPDGAVPGELDDAQERVIGKVIERAHTALLLALPWRSVTAPSLSVGGSLSRSVRWWPAGSPAEAMASAGCARRHKRPWPVRSHC